MSVGTSVGYTLEPQAMADDGVPIPQRRAVERLSIRQTTVAKPRELKLTKRVGYDLAFES